VVAHTARQRPDGEPDAPFFRNCFFFIRGLVALAPAQIAAVDKGGIAISDHEMAGRYPADTRPRRARLTAAGLILGAEGINRTHVSLHLRRPPQQELRS
jgi:hypothetical protein